MSLVQNLKDVDGVQRVFWTVISGTTELRVVTKVDGRTRIIGVVTPSCRGYRVELGVVVRHYKTSNEAANALVHYYFEVRLPNELAALA